MSITYTWQIEHIDTGLGQMVVKFTPEKGAQICLNIPMPDSGVDIGAHIAQFAPAREWQRAGTELAEVKVGDAGVGIAGEESYGEVPIMTGDFNEEYLRAMIYQVLEEIKDSQV